MSTVRKTKLSPQEYLALERKAENKSEYYDGEVFAFTGASRPHNLIVVNVLTMFNTQLRSRPSQVYPSHMRVKVSATGLYTYPDITVVCGEPEVEDEFLDTLLNPTVIVEVLSPSTEHADRVVKFAQYRRLLSVKEYVLIAQDSVRLEHYGRQDDGRWLLTEYSDPEQITTLGSIECELRLKDIYDKVVN